MNYVLYANDRRGEYPDSYYAATADLPARAPALEGEHKSDVCIIGAGYAGLSAALHLRQLGFEVTVLDAHRVGWGASGRNGGQVGSGQRMEQPDLEKLVGASDARKLWDISEDAKALVQRLIADLNIDCDYRPGIIHTNHKPIWTDETKEYVEHLHETCDYDKISYVPREEMRELLATEAYYDGTYDSGSGHLHPLKYVLGIAKACIDAGVKIFEQSEVAETIEGAPVRVKTAAGEVEAQYLILAANGYLGKLNKHTANRVIPINNYIIATEPLSGEVAASLIRNNAAVADTKYVINYYRLSADNRLLFGGRESYRYRFPRDIKSFVRKAMLSIYPQLSDTKIDYGWGGTLGITMNRMPHFEWLAPNMITVGGFSGHGVAMATMAGALAAEAVSGVAERFDVMAKVPTKRIPGGYSARLPLLALGMAFYSLRDKL